MRFVYVGNFLPAHSTENHLAKTLESLGHEVVAVQENAVSVNIIRDFCLRMNSENKGRVILLYTRTWGFLGDGIWLIEELRRAGITSVSYHLDLWVGLQREQEILANHPFWRTDFVFSPDGGHKEFFRDHGINHVYIPPAVYDKECYLGKHRPEYECDVVFVGSWKSYHPEWPYRKELVEWLAKTYGPRFKAFGHENWVRGNDLNDVYASAKVVVGDCIKAFGYTSDRLYETTGRGGFLIYPFVEGLENVPGVVYYEYFNLAELKEKIDYWVSHGDEREALRLMAHEFVKQNHTYVNRMQEMVRVIEQGHA